MFAECQLTVLVSKLFCNILICVLLVVPTNLDRAKLKTRLQYDESPVSLDESPRINALHWLCSLNENDWPDRNWTTDDDVIVNHLHLPNGSMVNGALISFGKCVASSQIPGTVVWRHPGNCYCQYRPAYVTLLAVAMVTVLVDFSCFTVPAIVACCLDKTPKISWAQECVAFMNTVVWTLVSCVGAYFHAVWNDEVWLPDCMHCQPYFQRPVTWTAAIVVAFFCALFWFVDLTLIITERKRWENKATKRKIAESLHGDRMETETPSGDESVASDVWDVESYSPDVMDRMINYRAPLKRPTNQSWP